MDADEGLLGPEDKRPRGVPARLKTPPYVTASPEVTHRKISGEGSKAGKLRFLVLATDGRQYQIYLQSHWHTTDLILCLLADPVYDRLSNEAVVGLVGAYLSQPKLSGMVSKAKVHENVVVDGQAVGVDGKRAGIRGEDELEGTYSFGRDTNVATLLIRNSLGESFPIRSCNVALLTCAIQLAATRRPCRSYSASRFVSCVYGHCRERSSLR